MINRQRLLTWVLSISLVLVCFLIGWLLYKQTNKAAFSVSSKRSMPDIQFEFAIGGEGSQGEYRLSEPMGVDIADNGDIYVADTLNSTVKVFDRKGTFKFSFGGKDLFYLPADLAVSNDRVFVVDGKNSRIQVFDLNGNFIRTFAGPEVGQKIGAWIPSAISVTVDGYVYATDIFYHRVIVFNKEGDIKNHFGFPGSGRGQMLYPNGLAVHRSGLIYVSDSNNGRIEVFGPGGKHINTLTTGGQQLHFNLPRGIAFGRKNFLYVADAFTHGIIVLDVQKDVFADSMVLGKRGVGDGEMNFPNDVAIKQNTLCVADRANNRILVYSVDE